MPYSTELGTKPSQQTSGRHSGACWLQEGCPRVPVLTLCLPARGSLMWDATWQRKEWHTWARPCHYKLILSEFSPKLTFILSDTQKSCKNTCTGKPETVSHLPFNWEHSVLVIPSIPFPTAMTRLDGSKHWLVGTERCKFIQELVNAKTVTWKKCFGLHKIDTVYPASHFY